MINIKYIEKDNKTPKKPSKLNTILNFFNKNHNKTSKIKEKTDKNTVKVDKNQLRKDKNDILKLKKSWNETMGELNLCNNFNQIFTLYDVEIMNYGYRAKLRCPKGLSFSMIEDSDTTISKIQDSMECKIFIKGDDFRREIIFRYKEFINIDYEPLKLKPWELYVGVDTNYEQLVLNMLKYPHILIQGSNNMGKTKCIDTMLVNLINNCSDKDIELYIAKADKPDQIIYRRCNVCKGYADGFPQIYSMLKYIISIIDKRDSIITPYIENGLCSNIFEYNKAISKGLIKNKKWSYIYLVIDEYSSLMPESNNNDVDKQICKLIQTYLERLARIGRYVGVYIVAGVQRSTIDKLPSFIKAMCNSIITFRVNNLKSSEVAIDSHEAVDLKPREFIYKTNSKYYGKTVNLTQQSILNNIKPFSKENYSVTSFIQYNDLEQILNKSNKKKRKTKQERKKTKEELLKKVKLEETKKEEDLKVLITENNLTPLSRRENL